MAALETVMIAMVVIGLAIMVGGLIYQRVTRKKD